MSDPIEYKKGWLVRRVRDAAKEYDSWPELVKKALKLNTGDSNV